MNDRALKSGHGGSPPSGFVIPGGLENLQPANEGGKVLEPPEVVEMRKQAAERLARAVNLERRRIGLEVLKQMAAFAVKEETIVDDTTLALKYADELIKQTGGI